MKGDERRAAIISAPNEIPSRVWSRTRLQSAAQTKDEKRGKKDAREWSRAQGELTRARLVRTRGWQGVSY